MRIAELSLRNFRVFEEVDLELPAQVIGIFGVNGAGKSALMESVQWALYGKARTSKDLVRTHGILTDCVVRVVFDHGGQRYEVRRTIRGKNHQTDAELYVGDLQQAAGVTEVDAEIRQLLRMDHQVFRASVYAEQKQLDAFSDVRPGERKKMVLRLLGIRPVEVAVTGARREARDAKGNAERLAASVPDLAALEAALEEARRKATEAEGRAQEAARILTEAEGRAAVAEEAFEASDTVRERVEKIAVDREATERAAADAGDRQASLSQRVQALRTAVAELPGLEAEAAGLEGARDRLAAAERLSEAVEGAARLESKLAALGAVDAAPVLEELSEARDRARAAQQAASRAESSAERARDELAEARAALDRADQADPSEPCPTCGRPLGDDFTEYVAHCRTVVARRTATLEAAETTHRDAAAALREAEERLAAATTRGEEVHRASEVRGRLEEELAAARARVDSLAEPFGGGPPEMGDLAAAAHRAEELGVRLAELRGQRARLTEAEADLAGATADLDRARVRIAELDREVAGLAFDPEEHARLRKERDEASRLLTAARGQDRDAAATEAEARQVLGRLEGSLEQARRTAEQVDLAREEARYVDRVATLLDGFRDHLVARIGPELSREAEALFRELTNHEYEDLKIDEDTLAIHISDAGAYFGMERFSGSETDLANLALRVAISMHLSRVSGADVGMMVLDEALGALDAERKDLFVQTMGRLSGRFHQLFVITHAEQVKDQFPASVEVRKVGRRRSQAVLV